MACFDALSSIFLIIIRIKCKYIYIFLVNVAIIEGLNSMVTFWGPTIWFLKGVGVGVACMGDLVWVRISSSQTSGVWIFFLTHNGVRFFSQHYRPWKIFFQCKNFFLRYYLARFFPLEISLQDIYFWNHPYPPPPSKVKWSDPYYKLKCW